MQKLTWKEMTLLSCLMIGGCCDTFDSYDIYVPQQKEDYSNAHSYKYPTERVVTHPYVVNNTPHIRKQPLPSTYTEKVKDIGLVGANGELL